MLFLCTFHREQSWVRWLSKTKNGLSQSKESVLKLLRAVADSLDVENLRQNILNLVSSDLWKNSPKLQAYFCRFWLPKYEMWVEAYRKYVLEVVVNTTNGVERMNRQFKNFLSGHHDKSLSSLATVLVIKFSPYILGKYVDANIKPLQKLAKYDEEKLPRWCWSRPRKFQIHIFRNYSLAKDLSMSKFTFNKEMKWEYQAEKIRYTI